MISHFCVGGVYGRLLSCCPRGPVSVTTEKIKVELFSPGRRAGAEKVQRCFCFRRGGKHSTLEFIHGGVVQGGLVTGKSLLGSALLGSPEKVRFVRGLPGRTRKKHTHTGQTCKRTGSCPLEFPSFFGRGNRREMGGIRTRDCDLHSIDPLGHQLGRHPGILGFIPESLISSSAFLVSSLFHLGFIWPGPGPKQDETKMKAETPKMKPKVPG